MSKNGTFLTMYVCPFVNIVCEWPKKHPIQAIQGVLGLHEFWAREKLVQAKFVLVKLCTSSFVKLRASKILSTCYLRNGLHLKISADEIRTIEIRASQWPPVFQLAWIFLHPAEIIPELMYDCGIFSFGFIGLFLSLYNLNGTKPITINSLQKNWKLA